VITGFLSMASGLFWVALVVDPQFGYGSQVPAMVLAGVGMGLFFAPASAILMGSVTPAQQGIASGVNNGLREVGGALGVALLASVFAANGGYHSPEAFTDGLRPALWVGAASLLVAAVTCLWIRNRHQVDDQGADARNQ
jgi:predicted MFS family arabinose efflux permease